MTVLHVDVGHLATFAAVAALRTQQRCQLKLPIRDGVIYLPALGRVTVPTDSSPSWADFVSDSNGATLASGSWKLHLAAAGSPSAQEAMIDWTPTHIVAAKSHGLAIRLSLGFRSLPKSTSTGALCYFTRAGRGVAAMFDRSVGTPDSLS